MGEEKAGEDEVEGVVLERQVGGVALTVFGRGGLLRAVPVAGHLQEVVVHVDPDDVVRGRRRLRKELRGVAEAAPCVQAAIPAGQGELVQQFAVGSPKTSASSS